jgi:hypothetical protein
VTPEVRKALALTALCLATWIWPVTTRAWPAGYHLDATGNTDARKREGAPGRPGRESPADRYAGRTWACPLLVLAAIVRVTFTLDWLMIERPWTWPLIVRVTVQLDTTLALPRLVLGGAWTVPPPVPTTPAETVLDWPRLILAGRTTVTAKAD